MGNPFNPLDWVKSTQDWFERAERSSGFRPYLIFLLLASGLGISILVGFPFVPEARAFAFLIMGVPYSMFIVLFSLKAFQDPDFCRSETHLRQMKKLELEHMGSESDVLPGQLVDELPAIEAPPRGNQIGASGESDE